MLWNIQPFVKTLFRRSEKTDTRQAIRREENVPQRRRGETDDNRRPRERLVDDQADVSVEALISFLSDMVESNAPDSQEKSFSSMAEDMTSPYEDDMFEEGAKDNAPKGVEQQGRVAQAASAYERTATDIEARSYAEQEDRPAQPADSAHVVDLKKGDRLFLTQKLAELRELSNRGVETMNISRGGTFYDALDAAIRFQQERLGL